MNGTCEEIAIELFEKGITEVADVTSIMLRWIGWIIIKFLAIVVNALEKTAGEIYTLMGFFDSTEINDLLDKYRPIIWGILALSFVIIGIKIIFVKIKDRSELPANLLYAIVAVMILPICMIKFQEITTLAANDLNNYNFRSANEIVKSNLYDIYYLAENDFNLDKKNDISKDDILYVDINEKLDTSEIDDDYKKVFQEKVVMDSGGELKLVKLKSGWFIKEQFFRYKLDFVITILTLVAISLTLVCMCFKIGKLIFELAFNKIFATFYAFADIESGKRLKEIINHIGAIFLVLISQAVSLRLYVLFNAYLSRTDIDDFVKVIVIIGVSLGVIDGPNIIERILGIDAGLKNGWAAMMGTYGVAKSVGSGMKGLGGLLKKPAKKLGSSAWNKGKQAFQEYRANKKESSLAQEMKDFNNKNPQNQSKNNPLNAQMSAVNGDNKSTKSKSTMSGDDKIRKNQSSLQSEMNAADKAKNSKVQQPLNDAIRSSKNNDSAKSSMSNAMKDDNIKDNLKTDKSTASLGNEMLGNKGNDKGQASLKNDLSNNLQSSNSNAASLSNDMTSKGNIQSNNSNATLNSDMHGVKVEGNSSNSSSLNSGMKQERTDQPQERVSTQTNNISPNTSNTQGNSNNTASMNRVMANQNANKYENTGSFSKAFESPKSANEQISPKDLDKVNLSADNTKTLGSEFDKVMKDNKEDLRNNPLNSSMNLESPNKNISDVNSGMKNIGNQSIQNMEHNQNSSLNSQILNQSNNVNIDSSKVNTQKFNRRKILGIGRKKK